MAKLYVAYGSNLNKDQMQWRCPRAKFVGTGVIEDYELQFKGSLRGAHATISWTWNGKWRMTGCTTV